MSTEFLDLNAVDGGWVGVVRVSGGTAQGPMIELTALRDHDWPVRLTLAEAEAVENALRDARLS